MNSREAYKIKKLFKKLCRQKIYKFPKKREKILAPKQDGVYIIYNPKGAVVHVGRTQRGKRGLWRRLGDHLRGHSSFANIYLKGNPAKLRKGYRFRYLIINNPRKRALAEILAIAKLCPKHLGLGE